MIKVSRLEHKNRKGELPHESKDQLIFLRISTSKFKTSLQN